MAFEDYDATPASNTSIAGIDVGENCSPAGINDAIRQLMADAKAYSNEEAARAAENAVIRAEHTFASTTEYTRTAQTDSVFSDNFNFTPEEQDSAFTVEAGVTYTMKNTDGGITAAASLAVQYFTTSTGQWTQLLSNSVGVRLMEPSNTAGGADANETRGLLSLKVPTTDLIIAAGVSGDEVTLRCVVRLLASNNEITSPRTIFSVLEKKP